MKSISVLIILLSFLISCGPVLDIPDEVNVKEVKENFIAHKNEISELKAFYNSITPKNLEVYIEFNSDTLIDLEILYITNPKYPIKTFFEHSSINPYNYKEPASSVDDSSEYAAYTKSLEIVKKELGWTNETFRTIKKYLDNANCISVKNGEPANIGFRRSGFGKYFYNLFDTRLESSIRMKYSTDTCHYRMFNDTLILEYQTGVYGPNCFPDK